MLKIGISNSIGSGSFVDVLPEELKAKFLFLWTGKVDGDHLLNDLGEDFITITGKDFTGSIIPPNTEATFAVPENATYLAADGSDDWWFSVADILQQKTHEDLISGTTGRTFIKYADFPPYNVYIIGILKTGETLTDDEKNTLSRYFKLWLFYFGTYSDYGYLKDNRTIE